MKVYKYTFFLLLFPAKYQMSYIKYEHVLWDRIKYIVFPEELAVRELKGRKQ